MLRWFKQERPELPVLVLQAAASEVFAGADGVALAERPTIWLAAVGVCIDKHVD